MTALESKLKTKLWLLGLLVVAEACSNPSIKDEQGTWFEVKKNGGDYVFTECGEDMETIRVTQDSLIYHGLMEDFVSKINDVKRDSTSTLIDLDEQGKNTFRFSWIDKSKGIAKWELNDASNVSTIKHFVKGNYKNRLKTISGADCAVEFSAKKTEIKPDFTTADGTYLVKILDNNCINVYDKHGRLLVDHCFEVDFIEIRQQEINAIPLTFISGKHAIELEFSYDGQKWSAKKASYFSGGASDGKTKQLDVRLKDFDFDEVRTLVVE